MSLASRRCSLSASLRAALRACMQATLRACMQAVLRSARALSSSWTWRHKLARSATHTRIKAMKVSNESRKHNKKQSNEDSGLGSCLLNASQHTSLALSGSRAIPRCAHRSMRADGHRGCVLHKSQSASISTCLADVHVR